MSDKNKLPRRYKSGYEKKKKKLRDADENVKLARQSETFFSSFKKQQVRLTKSTTLVNILRAVFHCRSNILHNFIRSLV